MTLPLKGCRVLDLGIITAGAATSAVLADLGADVIKIEGPNYPDPFREWPAGSRYVFKDNISPFFRSTNRNKRGLSLDLKNPSGAKTFLRLVKRADVVVENFRRGVLDRLGVGYSALKAANPKIVLASVSSQGENGPDANYASYGSTLEAMAGLAALTGYKGDDPVITGRDLNYPDQVIALFAAAITALAWRNARQTGEGAHLDISQRDLTTFLCGDAVVASAGGNAPPRVGNEEIPFVLQDCYRAADGRYVAVSVEAGDMPALGTLLGTAKADEAALRGWVGAKPSADAVKALLSANIAAAESLSGVGVLAQEGKLWSYALKRADADAMFKGFPFQLRETPLDIYCDAPGIGTDTENVLREIGGYSKEEIEFLIGSSVASVAAIAAE